MTTKRGLSFPGPALLLLAAAVLGSGCERAETVTAFELFWLMTCVTVISFCLGSIYGWWARG